MLGASAPFWSIMKELPLAKPKRIRDEKYLRYIRSLPCNACPKPAPSIPHHTKAGGMGTKCSDYETVPLCKRCHDQIEAINGGKLTFDAKHPGVFITEPFKRGYKGKFKE